MSSYSGKAILNVERDYDPYSRHRVHAVVLSCSGSDENKTAIQEDLGEGFTLPHSAYELELGDRAVYLVSFTINYTCWEGEWDCNVWFNRVRRLRTRIQRENKPEKIMLLQTLKKKIVDYIMYYPAAHECIGLLSQAQAQGRHIRDYIGTMDGDKIIDLIKVIPHAFPRKMRIAGDLLLEANIHGALRVVPIPASKSTKTLDDYF
jgi:hypothetical protein